MSVSVGGCGLGLNKFSAQPPKLNFLSAALFAKDCQTKLFKRCVWQIKQ